MDGRSLHNASAYVYLDMIDSYTRFLIHFKECSLSLIPSLQCPLVKVRAALVARGLQCRGQWREPVFEIEGRPRMHPDRVSEPVALAELYSFLLI